ncbi:MAG: sulfatase-like hydrolase/transferase, partial [Chlorobi bacterium]|nr:sulfatase-like hydrolase/transferase [Chlorobiota bacterium]
MFLTNETISAQSTVHTRITDSSYKKPNIVIINMDDMGYGDLDSYGAIGYKTPNLDKLEDRGMRFTNFYAVEPTCTSSRVGLLTGTYPNRIGLGGMALFPHSETGG